MEKTTQQYGAFLAVIIVLIIGGLYYNNKASIPSSTNEPEQQVEFIPKFSFINMKPLTLGVYKVWALDDSNTFTLGSFNINDGYELVSADGSPFVLTLPQDLFWSDIKEVFITIQDEESYSPSDTVILETKDISLKKDFTFPVDLKNSQAQVHLGTATPQEVPSGLWFFNPDTQKPTLALQEAPRGWVYEAWLQDSNELLSLGRFTSPTLPDGQAQYYEPQETDPKFPGEDFLIQAPQESIFPIDFLQASPSYEIFITLEPGTSEYDPTGDLPFQFTLFKGEISGDGGEFSLFPLTPQTLQKPKGTLTIDTHQ